MPFFAPAWSFGGVQADQVIALITILCTATLFFCALGVFFGAILKGALASLAVRPGRGAVPRLRHARPAPGVLDSSAATTRSDALLWLNPFLALLSAGGTATDAFARGAPAAYRSVLSLPPQSWAPGLLLPAWVIGSLAWTALAVLLRGRRGHRHRANSSLERQARPMTMLSPAATYHAELREQLGLGRTSASRSSAASCGWRAAWQLGTVVVLGLVIWAWVRDIVSSLPLALLIGVPIGAALLTALGSLFIRHNSLELARRVDRAAQLHERSTTALELGAQGEEFPLALAQMRDAVEHLQAGRPARSLPAARCRETSCWRRSSWSSIAVIVGVSPNPWLLRARASNPAITIAREEAQRVQRLADSIQPQDSAELNALRQLVSKGAKTIDARSNEPDAALNAIQDLEDQVRQMSAGDDQLSAALAAIAAALASDPATQQLASAINTGDMRQIAQAAKDLAQASQSMSSQDQAARGQSPARRGARRPSAISQSVSGDLSDAADALQARPPRAAPQPIRQPDQSQSGQSGQQQPAARAPRTAARRATR